MCETNMADFSRITLAELVQSTNPVVKRHALGIRKELERFPDARMCNCTHGKECKTYKEYGTCPPWPHA